MELTFGMEVINNRVRFTIRVLKWPEMSKVILRSTCIEKPYDYKLWPRGPMTWAKNNAEVKGHAGVIWGQLEFNMSSNAIWPPNLSRRTIEVCIVLCWGQRSCRGHLGSMRSIFLAQTYDHQIRAIGPLSCPENYAEGSKVMQRSSGVN